MQMAVKDSFIPFIGYLSLFYLAWAFVWVDNVYPWATGRIGDATLMYALINCAFRLLIWVLPVFLYLRYKSVVTSTVISSILFVGAHIPGWIMLGSLTAYKVFYIFVFGAVMAIIFRYSRSLWAPIITHSLNDALSNVIFHI